MGKLTAKDFFPRALQDKGLFDQVLFAVEKLLQDTDTELRDVVEKYFDFTALPADLLEEIVEEQGYQYILDVLDLSESQIRSLTQLISVIHFFKGHKDGLVLTLGLLGFVGSTTEEWWEQSPQGGADTFKLTLNLNQSTISSTAIPRLLSFIRAYVYPVLEELILVSDIVDGEAYVLGTKKETRTGTITTHL